MHAETGPNATIWETLDPRILLQEHLLQKQTLSFFPQHLFYIALELIDDAVLVSGVQQSDSVIHTLCYLFFFKLFSLLGHYRILSKVPCAKQ